MLKDDRQYYVFKEIEAYRKKLLSNNTKIEVTDLGAGSLRMKSTLRKISSIAKTSLQKPKQAQLLFRLMQWSESQHTLELGSSLGITSAYLASVSKQSQVTTIEGCPEIAQVAKKTLSDLGQTNAQLLTGNFDDVLPELLEREVFDFALLDGNHSYEATIRYVNLLMASPKPPSIIVLDDIYWSKGMTAAWHEIIERNEFQISLDLFEMGILFVKPGIEKQNFRLRV